MTYDEFLNAWGNGVRQVTKYGGQCVALIAEYEAENNRPIVWGEKGAVLWINNPTMLPVYTWIDNNPSDPNQLPNRGDIVVWNGNLPYSDGSGHIAFYDHNLANHQMMTYGQNSGGPTAHFQPHSWDYVAGWYTPKYIAPPAPAPVAAPAAIVHPYTISTEGFPKQVVFNKAAHKWGMTYDNFTAIANNPIPGGEHNPGDQITVYAVCHHNIGYSYYLPDEHDPAGYNTLDCDDYVAPPITPAPAPAPPPAIKWPDAPLPIKKVEPYELKDTIKYYGTPKDAIIDQNALGTLDPKRSYIVWERSSNGMINLTTDNQKDQQQWINPGDNVLPEVVPVAVKPVEVQPAIITPVAAPEAPKPPVIDTSWQKLARFFPDGRAVPYKTTNLQPFRVYDLKSKEELGLLKPGMPLHLVGTFNKDGSLYGATAVCADQDEWPNIPMHNVRVDYIKMFLQEVRNLKLMKRIDGIFKDN